jgi:hypothetical protein
MEGIVLSEASQVQKDKGHMFSHIWKIDPKDKHIHKNMHDYTQTYVNHICNSGTTLWNLGEQGKEKRMIEHQQYQNHYSCAVLY